VGGHCVGIIGWRKFCGIGATETGVIGGCAGCGIGAIGI